MNRRQYLGRCVLGAWALSCVATMTLAANPKTTNPNHDDATLPLAVHGDEPSVKLQEAAQARYLVALKATLAALDKEAKRQVNKIEPKPLGEANVALMQLQRAADQLSYLGEPAGPEFQRRRTALNQQVPRLAQLYAQTPEGTAFLAKARQFLNNNQKERQNSLKRIQELINKKNFVEAEKTLYDVLDKLGSITVFLPSAELPPIYDPFAEVQRLVVTEMMRSRMVQAKEILAKRLQDLAPDLDGLLAEAGKVAPSVQTTGKAEVDGQMVNGPGAVEALLAKWQKSHAAIQRLNGVALAAQSGAVSGMYVSGAAGGPGMGMPNAPSATNPVVQRYATKFWGEMIGALARVIAADAQRAGPEEVPVLYAEYLRVTALPMARAPELAPKEPLREALKSLAAKSPTFLNDVTSYAEATDELLRWKRRTASALAANQQQQFPDLVVAFPKVALGKDTFLGMYSSSAPDVGVPQLLAQTPDTIPPIAQQFLGAKVAANMGRGLAGGKNAVTELWGGMYVTHRAVQGAVAPAIASLESELLVTEASPPLSLNAASVLQTARAGDWRKVGGEVAGIHVEGYVTRLAGLPDAAWPLVAFGSIPAASRGGDGTATAAPSLSYAAVRFDVRPQWVEHEAFFAVIPPAEEAAGAE